MTAGFAGAFALRRKAEGRAGFARPPHRESSAEPVLYGQESPHDGHAYKK